MKYFLHLKDGMKELFENHWLKKQLNSSLPLSLLLSVYIQYTAQDAAVVSAAITVALTMVTGFPHQVGSLVDRNEGTQDCRDLWETRVHFRLRITLKQNRWSALKKRYKTENKCCWLF